MSNALVPVLISCGLILGGFTGIFWPAFVYSLNTDNESNIPSLRRRCPVRIGSFVMFLMGCIGLYAFVTWDGTPPDGPLF